MLFVVWRKSHSFISLGIAKRLLLFGGSSLSLGTLPSFQSLIGIIWMLENLGRKQTHGSMSSWHLFFGVGLDVIWRARNEFVFSQKSSSSQLLLWKIKKRVATIRGLKQRDRVLRPVNSNQEDERLISWKCRPTGFLTLNCDGVVSGASSLAGCGGILINDSGEFLFAFSHKLEPCSVLEAELWAIYHGMSIAWGRGFRNLIVESESANAIKLLSNFSVDLHPLANLV